MSRKLSLRSAVIETSRKSQLFGEPVCFEGINIYVMMEKLLCLQLKGSEQF